MKRIANGGMWLPDGEQDRVMIGAGAKYQSNKLMPALALCKYARTAVDVGAHCGLWSVQLGQYFERVHCFEPLPLHIECWKKNLGWKTSCVLHEVALGAEAGTCGMRVVDGLSGRSHVNGHGEYPMRRLDDFELSDVDFLKVDVEGYELFVLMGAQDTIARNKPIIVVEQKPQHGGRFGLTDTAAVDWLNERGYEVRQEIVGDFVMVPRAK